MARKTPTGKKSRRGTQPSTTGKVLNVRAEQANWRRTLQTSKVKFDDDQKEIFLRELRDHGLKGRAAEVAGVSPQSVHNHRDNDPDFAEALEAAVITYRDKISAEVRRRGRDGWLEPIFHKGERAVEPILDDQGQIVTIADGTPMFRYTAVRKFSDRLLELEAKRVEPQYRDKQTIDVNTTGGVLLAPAGMTPEEAIAEGERANEEARKRRLVEEQKRLRDDNSSDDPK